MPTVHRHFHLALVAITFFTVFNQKPASKAGPIMESTSDHDVSPAKVARRDMNYSLCIVCQSQTLEPLVQNPVIPENLLHCIRERAKYGDQNYPDISRRLGGITCQELELKSATWHRTCYQKTVHVGMCNRAKERFEKDIARRIGKREGTNESYMTGNFTRSQSVPYDKDACFFCDSGNLYKNPLHKVATDHAGRSLEEAVKRSGNESYSVKLNTALSLGDAHSIDIKYHRKCWSKHVSNVIRKPQYPMPVKQSKADEVAAEIEFLSLVENELNQGKVASMSALQHSYIDILSANNVKSPECSRKKLKHILQAGISDLEFHKQNQVNQSELVTVKSTRDKAVQMVDQCDTGESDSDMKTLFDAACLLRKAMDRAEKWTFTGSYRDFGEEHLPKQLYSFFRWVLQGPKTTLSTDRKSSEVSKHAISLSQTTMTMFLSQKQIQTKSDALRCTHEMPQQLAVGVAIRQAIRSKKIINMLHGFGLSAEYNRLLRLEARIASTVLQRMQANDNVYLPPDIILGRHIFFAIDNIDFTEDTPDGKNTTHATAIAIYQQCHSEDVPTKLELSPQGIDYTIQNLPKTVTTILDCPKPCTKPSSPVYPSFLMKGNESLVEDCIPDIAWLIGRTWSMAQAKTPEETSTPEESVNLENKTNATCIQNGCPPWSAYHSGIHEKLPKTRVCTPPLVAAPAHEWQTLLTVLKLAQGINTKVVGPDRKTVVSLDMGLYKPAKQLQMARDDLEHVILRPGELHIVMAQLRCIGAYIENSGLDFSLVEAGLYGPLAVRQIIEGKHVKRGVEAHLITLQALFRLYQEAFVVEYPALFQQLAVLADEISCAFANNSCIQEANQKMVQAIKSLEVMAKMNRFNLKNNQQPLKHVMLNYMQMVLQMIMFIRSVRTGNWKLHLTTTESFAKHCFAHDKLVYARMMPLYLADMQALKMSDTEVYEEFQRGNWVVNKNPNIPFCAIGADHALEQVNRSLKVEGGLVGITLNANARLKFFLIAPEMSRLAEEAWEMAGPIRAGEARHHALSPAVQLRHNRNVEALTSTLRSFTDPFADDCDELFNLVTKKVMPEDVKEDLCQQPVIGEKLLKAFISTRIVSGETNLWAPMTKCNLKTWKTTGKKLKLAVEEKVVELREDRNLFARMLIVSKSRPELNLADTIGNHELSLVPRSMFAADGTMLHCGKKSDLLSVLEKLPEQQDMRVSVMQSQGKKVAILDAMALVQTFDKQDTVCTCSDLAESFCSDILEKHKSIDELHLIFDQYLPHSLKNNTREKRRRSQEEVSYRIHDTTKIASVAMKQLLSSTKTKGELAAYLAEKMLAKAHTSGRDIVVAWDCNCKATHRDVAHLKSTQEEADTKMVLHAHEASVQGASSIRIYSPDTDVLVLFLHQYPQLCQDVYIVTGAGQRRRTIPLKPIYEALGGSKVDALPGLHAFSGADITGSFAGKGKLSFWKAFKDADDDCIGALASLGRTQYPPQDTCLGLERFLCTVYRFDTTIKKVEEMRWWLFAKKQVQAENLPPTQAALHQAILRAHYQTMVWVKATIPRPEIPSPSEYGWTLEAEQWVPVMTLQNPAPQAVLSLVKCACSKSKCQSQRCSCRKAGLSCTDICGCSDMGDDCENTPKDSMEHEEDSEEEEEEE